MAWYNPISWWDTVKGAISGVTDAAINAIKDAIHAVIGWAESIFQGVTTAWDTMLTGAGDLVTAIAGLGEATWHAISRVIRITIRDLRLWTGRIVAGAVTFTRHVLTWTVGQVAGLVARIAHGLTALTRWVLAHVWTPLATWIRTTGARTASIAETIWRLVTHPDRLAKLLWRYVVVEMAAGAAWVATYLGRLFFRLILRQTATLVGWLEDFIAQVL